MIFQQKCTVNFKILYVGRIWILHLGDIKNDVPEDKKSVKNNHNAATRTYRVCHYKKAKRNMIFWTLSCNTHYNSQFSCTEKRFSP